MDASTQKEIGIKTKRLLENYYSNLGFSCSDKLVEFSKNNMIINLGISGDYYSFVTIRPTFRLLDETLIKEIQKSSGEKIYFNLNFGLSELMADQVIESGEMSDEVKQFYEHEITTKYKIYADSDLTQMSLNHMRFMNFFGLKFLSLIDTNKSLYSFLRDLLLQRRKLSDESIGHVSKKVLMLDRFGVMTLVMLGFILEEEDIKDTILLVFEIYNGNDYILKPIRKIIGDKNPHIESILPS